MRKVVLAVGALAIAAAIAAFFFVTHQRTIATDLRAPIPTPLASSTPKMPPPAQPQPGQSSHFLPQLPPPQLVPRRPSLFRAPAKAKAGNPP
jgi:hypothetical protein